MKLILCFTVLGRVLNLSDASVSLFTWLINYETLNKRKLLKANETQKLILILQFLPYTKQARTARCAFHFGRSRRRSLLSMLIHLCPRCRRINKRQKDT